MRYGLIVGAVCCVLAFCSGTLWAQEAMELAPAEARLDTTLGGLQESVLRLLEENKSLAASNEVLRKKVAPIQSQLAGIQAEGNKLAEQMRTIELRYQEKAAGLRALEDRLAAARVQLATVEAEVDKERNPVGIQVNEGQALQLTIEGLQREIADLKSSQDLDAETNREMGMLRSRKEKLQGQLKEAEAQLARTKEEWQAMNRDAALKPEVPELRQERDALQGQINGLQAEIQGIKDQVASQKKERLMATDGELTPERMLKVEQEGARLQILIDGLDKEIRVLEATQGMQSQKKTASDTQKTEYKELQARFLQLRSEMDRLRQEMIILDKKKLAVEGQLYKQGY